MLKVFIHFDPAYSTIKKTLIAAEPEWPTLGIEI
jgi:hypothetical protein